MTEEEKKPEADQTHPTEVNGEGNAADADANATDSVSPGAGAEDAGSQDPALDAVQPPYPGTAEEAGAPSPSTTQAAASTIAVSSETRSA